MPNEIILKIGAEGDVGPGVEAAIQPALAAQEELSAATAQAAQEDADHLKLVEAQYGQLGTAAAKAYGQAMEAADAASAAVEKFGKATSLRGIESGAKNAALAIARLETEIKTLRDAGGNVEALEARLRELQAEMERNVQKSGKMRKAIADLKDEMKASTARAGELEGQIGSLEGILNVLGASTLGNVASKAVALQGALLITVAAAKQVYEILDALTKQAAAAWEESLSRQDAAMRAASGETGQYAANLRNVLAKNGYDVASASLAELLKMEEEFAGRLRSRGAQVGKLQGELRKDLKALHDDTAGTIADLEAIGDEELRNSELGSRAVAAVRELMARYKELGEEAPDALKKWSIDLERIAGQHEDLISILDRLLGAVGVRGPAAIDKQIDALRDYAGEVERSGDVTVEQAQMILGAIDQIRKAVQLLPEDQREAADGMLDALGDIEDRYRDLASVALATFGVQTPDAIERSISKVQGLIEAFGPLGKVTAEQATIVVAALQQILDAISVLPAEQRAAMKDQETAIRALADQYGEIAVRRKQYAEDIIAAEEKQLAREKKILAERQELLSTFADVFDQLQAKLASRSPADPGADVEKLREELKKLQDVPLKSAEQVAQIAALEDEISKTAATTFGFADANKAAALSAGEVDDALAGLIDSIKGVEGGFANLPLASRAAIENMVGRLQQAAQEGTATKEVLNDAFLTVGRIIDDAGGSMGDLGTAINRANEDTLNLRREFGELEQGLFGVKDAAAEMGEAQKDAATVAKERAEAATKAAQEEKKAIDASVESQGAELEIMERKLVIWERLLIIAKEYRDCVGSTAFG